VVPCHKDEVWIMHSMRGGEVHGVIAPKAVRLGKLPCVTGQRVVDLDEVELFVSRVELGDRSPKLATRQSSEAVRVRESRTTLGVHESGAHDAVGRIPECGGGS
jgi:hypothetical protein